MVYYYHFLSKGATIMMSKNCPITGEHSNIIFVTQCVTIATLWPAKNAYISKTTHWNFFLISNFYKQDKMQVLAKLKKNSVHWFMATLNFRKFKVAPNLMYRLFLNFAKSCILFFLPKLDNKNWKNSPRAVSETEVLKARIRVFLARHTVALVTYSVIKLVKTCLPMTGQLF